MQRVSAPSASQPGSSAPVAGSERVEQSPACVGPADEKLAAGVDEVAAQLVEVGTLDGFVLVDGAEGFVDGAEGGGDVVGAAIVVAGEVMGGDVGEESGVVEVLRGTLLGGMVLIVDVVLPGWVVVLTTAVVVVAGMVVAVVVVGSGPHHSGQLPG